MQELFLLKKKRVSEGTMAREYEGEANSRNRVSWTDTLSQMALSHGSNTKVARAVANGSTLTERREKQARAEKCDREKKKRSQRGQR